MQKLNDLGVELQSLKVELLKKDYPDVVKKALALSATEMVKKEIIDVDLHLGLTNELMKKEDFDILLSERRICMKTDAEMLVDFEKVREVLQEKLVEADEYTTVTSKSMVELDKILFTQTFMLDKQWVSEYFGQPADEVVKLMSRNGFVEKFAVLRLGKILNDFLKNEDFIKHKHVECKATKVFFDVDKDFYGIHLLFYVPIEEAEDPEKAAPCLDYIVSTVAKVKETFDERMKI